MKNNNLTLKDLANILNSMSETDKNAENKIVEIPLRDEAIGSLKSTTIAGCCLGFDWDSGRVFLYPRDPLVSQSYMKDYLYGNWHPYPKYKPKRPGTYWVTIDNDGTPFCMELETLNHPDSIGHYDFYCTKKITAWKERIVPKPYCQNV